MLLEVKNLSVFVNNKPLLNDINFSLDAKQTIGLVGESGSGKTLTAFSLINLLPNNLTFSSNTKILLRGENIIGKSDSYLQNIRGKDIGFIFQEPNNALNPLHNIFTQLKEVILAKEGPNKQELMHKIHKLLDEVGLGDLKKRLDAYPHQLSGGQKQRLVIAKAIANLPKILIADEPSTALDSENKRLIFDLLVSLKEKYSLSLILISHDIKLVKNYAERVLIFKEGKIIETGSIEQIFNHPQNPYTKELVDLNIIKNLTTKKNINTGDIILCKNLSISVPIRTSFKEYLKNGFRANKKFLIHNFNFTIKEGSITGIMGESGSGKTTLALAIAKLITYTGEINYKFAEGFRKNLQIIFQDPFSALNPRIKIGEAIAEGLKANKIKYSEKDIDTALTEVGLLAEDKFKFPHQFSGGQKQRIVIARSLIIRPKVIIFDEATSALDIITQKNLIELLLKLKEKYNLTYIFISHDLDLIKKISDAILLIKNGKLGAESYTNN
ncbi:MAG: ATP-binding cassette domain-containing protein [Alphaproteobacteria bacterium]|jgi:microcin C transport system ATP-binding protein